MDFYRCEKIARLLFEDKKYHEAIDALLMCDIDDKRYCTAMFNIATCYTMLQDYENALKNFLTYLALKNKPDALVYYSIAVCYDRLGNDELSLEYTRKAIDTGGDGIDIIRDILKGFGMDDIMDNGHTSGPIIIKIPMPGSESRKYESPFAKKGVVTAFTTSATPKDKVFDIEFKLRGIMDDIDIALAEGNKEEFKRLSKEYANIRKEL